MPPRSLSSDEYPQLSSEIYWEWGPIRTRFELIDTLPPKDKISNVRIIPFTGDRPVVVFMENWGGRWSQPGGTLEPGEDYLQAVERELLEEAGAKLLSFVPFGAFHCWSEAEKPYRPHLPFPEFFYVVGSAEVELSGVPSNPPDGETISEVVATNLEDACQRLRTHPDGYWQAELYRLAVSIRSDKSR